MEKSVKEFEELITARDFVKTLIAEDTKFEGLNIFLGNMARDNSDKIPTSISLLVQLSKRLGDSRKSILDEELKAVEVKIAAYNDVFTQKASN